MQRTPESGRIMRIKGSKKSTVAKTKEGRCEVLEIGIQGFAECPCKGPNTCRYAMPFGYAFLCCYPKVAVGRPTANWVASNSHPIP